MYFPVWVWGNHLQFGIFSESSRNLFGICLENSDTPRLGIPTLFRNFLGILSENSAKIQVGGFFWKNLSKTFRLSGFPWNFIKILVGIQSELSRNLVGIFRIFFGIGISQLPLQVPGRRRSLRR